jgi:hypothetical protein
MENLMSLAWEYRYIIVAAIGFIVFAFVGIGYANIKKYINAGIMKAEMWAKDQTLADGQAKEDWVVSNIYPLIPFYIKGFVSEEVFRVLVRFFYTKLVDWLDDGKINGSCK